MMDIADAQRTFPIVSEGNLRTVILILINGYQKHIPKDPNSKEGRNLTLELSHSQF